MRVLETCLYARDLEAAERFYRWLGFAFVSRVSGRHVFFRAGEAMLLVFNPEASAVPGDLPPHAGAEGGHACFAVSQEEIAAWRARLEASGLEVRAYEWSGGRGTSLYFRDPAGNLLELAPPRIWGLDALAP